MSGVPNRIRDARARLSPFFVQARLRKEFSLAFRITSRRVNVALFSIGLIALMARIAAVHYYSMKPFGRYTRNQVEAKTARLCAQLGEDAPVIRIHGEPSQAVRDRARLWAVDGKLADGAGLYAFWNATDGRLRMMSFRYTDNTRPFGTVLQKAVAISLARGYLASILAGGPGYHGRIETVEATRSAWVLTGTVMIDGSPKPSPLQMRIDRERGLPTFVQLR